MHLSFLFNLVIFKMCICSTYKVLDLFLVVLILQLIAFVLICKSLWIKASAI